MKILSDLVKKPEICSPKTVELIAVLGGFRDLEQPIESDQLICTLCGNKQHYTVFVDPVADRRRVWICADGGCLTNKRMKPSEATSIPTTPVRALLWPLFCEINGIGDEFHDVRFENIEQNVEKIKFLKSFSENPKHIVYMTGGEGTGKTYAALGLCELFTRSNDSCVFITHQQLAVKWLQGFKDKPLEIIDKILTCSLLIIDDFGTADPTPGFMSYFMDMINSRMQWKKRGTVITTNLITKAFSDICGSALYDRIRSGQHMIFKDKSRRNRKSI